MICKRTRWGVGIVAVIGLISCWVLPIDSAETQAPLAPRLPENTRVEHLQVDGRLVTCVYYSAYGISCDWESARPFGGGPTPPA